MAGLFMNFLRKAGQWPAMAAGWRHERAALPPLHRPGGAIDAAGVGPSHLDPADTTAWPEL